MLDTSIFRFTNIITNKQHSLSYYYFVITRLGYSSTYVLSTSLLLTDGCADIYLLVSHSLRLKKNVILLLKKNATIAF